MQQKKVIPVKYFYIGMLVTALSIFGVIFYLYQKEKALKKLLAEKGVRGTAWVLSLNTVSIKKKKGSSTVDYNMDVAFFADTVTAQPITADTAVSKAKNGSDLVDKVFNKIHAETKPFGIYQTLTIPISKYQYQKYKVDDKVKIVYLKEDLTKIMLAEDVQ